MESGRRLDGEGCGAGPRRRRHRACHRPGARALSACARARAARSCDWSSFHTITGSWATLEEPDAEGARAGAGWRNGILWLSPAAGDNGTRIRVRADRTRPSCPRMARLGRDRRLSRLHDRHGPLLLPAREAQFDRGLLRRRPHHSVLGRGRQPVRRQHQLDQLHRDPGEVVRDQLAVPDEQPDRGARA